MKVESLPAVSHADRRRLLDRLGDADVHAAALESLGCLRLVEAAPPPAAGDPATAPPDRLRVGAWNVERGTWLAGSGRLLRSVAADVLLLSELDVGMARSGQRHVPRELAAAAGHGYAFAVEFLELGLGGRVERERHGGEQNEVGLHGNAVLSRRPLRRPAVLRFDRSGDWFTAERGEPRVGGRCAVAATVDGPGGGDLAVVATHLESHGDPDQRARQMAILLDAVDEYSEGGPAVVGGDLNTFSAPAVEIYSSRLRRELLAGGPDRFIDPVPHEPLFAEAARRGFTWEEANVRAPTQRTRRDGSPRPPLMHLDWILVRGLGATGPAVVPAVDDAGLALSDHELVAVTLVPLVPPGPLTTGAAPT